VHRCFGAGAVATGARWEVVGGDKPYAEMIHDADIAAAYQRNAEALGRAFPDLGVMLERAAGSTDMGNVSMALPAIHPFIGINSLPAVNHQPEFTAHCIKQEADQALHDGALAMAWTAIDVVKDVDLRDRLMAATRERVS
jgi:metal-dependent amidase/aminoacylase/carboxypeptidase family protein